MQSLSKLTYNLFQSTPSVGRETVVKLSPVSVPSKFQSTPSVGRETVLFAVSFCNTLYFNPLPPWGGRPRGQLFQLRQAHFNPLPPWGGRRTCQRLNPACKLFQSTPSVGRETKNGEMTREKADISIHSLRGEGDLFKCDIISSIRISIHSLRGEGDRRR